MLVQHRLDFAEFDANPCTLTCWSMRPKNSIRRPNDTREVAGSVQARARFAGKRIGNDFSTVNSGG